MEPCGNVIISSLCLSCLPMPVCVIVRGDQYLRRSARPMAGADLCAIIAERLPVWEPCHVSGILASGSAPLSAGDPQIAAERAKHLDPTRAGFLGYPGRD